MPALRWSLILFAVWLAGCATLRPDFETPSVKVVSFRPLPSESLLPRFEIGLRVVNPNPDALKLRGVSYTAWLDDYEIVTGAASDLPEVPAYGEAEFKLEAAVSLTDAMRFVNNLLQKPPGQVAYRLQARLDIGALLPAVRLEERGLLGPARDQARR